MAEGWIKLYRNIQDHWIWQDPQKLKWWLDILLLANHKENKFLLGGVLVTLERGEHHTSELKLAARWGVSKTTVRKFLTLLENDKMIELKKSKKGTTLKVTNYNDYQDFSEEEKPQKNHKKTIEVPQKNHKVYTNNNEKNDKNEKNNIYCPNSNEFRLASYLFNFILRNNPKAKEPNFKTWSKQFDYILRIDGRDIEEVKKVIKWCQNDNFWFKNILSPEKLREQYDRLLLSMKSPPKEEKVDTFNNYRQRDYNFNDLENKLTADVSEKDIEESKKIMEQIKNKSNEGGG